ncbi:hypothetical protein WJX81_002346 [Elliptochloris bilobata]|uniref:Uncharacterized protein n=1 Tax=Elliptochloris bilobata TaxID=381761 RepID=A0AAW1RB30_9CHLO
MCYGRITDATVVRDDRRVILLANPFGFGADGYIDLVIRNFQYWHQGAMDLTQTGIFVTTLEAEAQLEIDLAQGACALDAQNVIKLLTFDAVDANRKAGHDATGLNVHLPELVRDYAGGEYSLFFADCQPSAVVSFDVRASLYNVRANGRKDYLAVGEDMLPTMYMVMFVLFSVGAVLWAATVARSWAVAHRLHVLMGVLAAFKALTLLSQAGELHLVKTTGHTGNWNIAFYIFTFCRGILFFTVVVLIGTGWSYMKPLLNDREKKILMIVIPLQVCAEVAIIILDENTPASKSWFTWNDILHIVDIACCCAVLFPIIWSISHLRAAAATDGKAARNLLKLQLFRQFYVTVIVYMYFTRIVAYLLSSSLPYKYAWCSPAATELATLAFYVTTALAFRPAAENPYLSFADDELDLEELRERGEI